MDSKHRFGILVKREDNEWGLLSSCDPHLFFKGNFEAAVEHAENHARHLMSDWIWHAKITKEMKIAIIKFDTQKGDNWEIIKFI
jgi:hypothetical protein